MRTNPLRVFVIMAIMVLSGAAVIPSPGRVAAQGPTTISAPILENFEANATLNPLAPPNIVTIPISVQDVTDMDAYQITLKVNPAIIQLTGAAPGTLVASTCPTGPLFSVAVDVLSGVVQANEACLQDPTGTGRTPDAGFTGTGTLATVSAKVVAFGFSTLDLLTSADTFLRDIDLFSSTPITAAIVNAHFDNSAKIRDVLVVGVVPSTLIPVQGDLVPIKVTVSNTPTGLKEPVAVVVDVIQVSTVNTILTTRVTLCPVPTPNPDGTTCPDKATVTATWNTGSTPTGMWVPRAKAVIVADEVPDNNEMFGPAMRLYPRASFNVDLVPPKGGAYPSDRHIDRSTEGTHFTLFANIEATGTVKAYVRFRIIHPGGQVVDYITAVFTFDAASVGRTISLALGFDASLFPTPIDGTYQIQAQAFWNEDPTSTDFPYRSAHIRSFHISIVP